MILFYRILTSLIYPFLVLYIFFRKIKKKEDHLRFKEKIFSSNFKVIRDKNKNLIWFHAASIGEFKSIIPILLELNKQYYEFLITTTTLSSSLLARDQFKNMSNVHHRFLPLDIKFLIEKFIDLWRPNLIFLVDSEVWPNLLLKVNNEKIPLILLNGRITQKTFKRWKLFPKTAKKIFSLFDLCLTSNLETKKYLEELNCKKVYFYGNLKLINKINENQIHNVSSDILSSKRFWLAASIHKDEEIICLKTHYHLKKKYKKILSIIAPRHIERVKKIKSLFQKYNLKVQILEEGEKISEDAEVLILNTFGILQNYFKYAKSVFIGKSLIKKLENDGGQNPIDAAKLGCKIYHGPYVYNFREIYDLLEKKNISKQISTYLELSENLVNDLENPLKKESDATSSINSLGQITFKDTMKKINEFINNENL